MEQFAGMFVGFPNFDLVSSFLSSIKLLSAEWIIFSLRLKRDPVTLW